MERSGHSICPASRRVGDAARCLAARLSEPAGSRLPTLRLAWSCSVRFSPSVRCALWRSALPPSRCSGRFTWGGRGDGHRALSTDFYGGVVALHSNRSMDVAGRHDACRHRAKAGLARAAGVRGCSGLSGLHRSIACRTVSGHPARSPRCSGRGRKPPQIQQSWTMFAPDPSRMTRSYAVRATLGNGSHVTEPAGSSFRWTLYLGVTGLPWPPGDPWASCSCSPGVSAGTRWRAAAVSNASPPP